MECIEDKSTTTNVIYEYPDLYFTNFASCLYANEGRSFGTGDEKDSTDYN